MTFYNKERLAEIETRLSGQQARCIGGSFAQIKYAREDFADNAGADVSYLINRVRVLEAALERIGRMCDTGVPKFTEELLPLVKVASKALHDGEDT